MRARSRGVNFPRTMLVGASLSIARAMPISLTWPPWFHGSAHQRPYVDRAFARHGRIDPRIIHIRKTLRTTPAMAAGVTKRLWEIGDIIDVLEAWETAKRVR
jgi:hypothetical protein